MASESPPPKPPPIPRTEAPFGPTPFVSLDEMEYAWEVVRRHLHRTPIVAIPPLAPELENRRLFAKLETRQVMGSFKTRGAIVRLSAPDRRSFRGIVTSSAGNHGLGVGWAGCTLGIDTTVVVPSGISEYKRLRLEEVTPLIIAPHEGYDETEEAARTFARHQHALFVSPFDDPLVAAGNGATLAREILEERPDCDAIVVPVGGGGLAAGVARYVEDRAPSVAVVGVQSEANRAMSLSFQHRRPMVHSRCAPSLAEALEGGVSERTYEVAARVLRQMVTVREESIVRAMALIFQEMGEVVEGAAAVPLAAALEGTLPEDYRSPCLVFTGRNVSRTVLDEQLEKVFGPARQIAGR